MSHSLVCPECRAHFTAPDEILAHDLLRAHLTAEHGFKVDEKTRAYIVDLETEIALLKVENQALKSKKRNRGPS